MIDLPALASRCCRPFVHALRHHALHVGGAALLGGGVAHYAPPLAGHSWHRDRQPPGVVARLPGCAPGLAGTGYGPTGGEGLGSYAGGFGPDYGQADHGADVSSGLILSSYPPDAPASGFGGALSGSGFVPADATAVPEPSSWMLLACGVAAVVAIRRIRP